MNNRININYMIVAIIFLWIGFICAISFMESWLKFKASGVTLPIGLSIGKLVFNALNKVEWLFCIVTILLILTQEEKTGSVKNIFFIVAIVILLLQTFWLLPQLNLRTDMRIQNITPPQSNVHFTFVVCEVIKVSTLTLLGILNFK